MAPINKKSDLNMLFNFGKKPASNSAVTSAVKSAPAKAVTSQGKSPAAKPTPPKQTSSKPAPTPMSKFLVNPMKSITKTTTSSGKSSQNKQANLPVRSTQASSGFLGGLVGSDVEAPEFDPFQLSAERSEETINWYRAAELKVRDEFSICFSNYGS